MTTRLDFSGRGRGLRPHGLVTGLLAMLMALALFSTAGCGDDASSSSMPDASERDGDPGDGDAMQPIDARPAPDADPNAPDAGGRSCGGFVGDVCSDTEFCDFPEPGCDYADATGICKDRPDICQPAIDPVCGCDGRDYQNECEAYKAGTDVAQAEPC
jgi:hypothetical protein